MEGTWACCPKSWGKGTPTNDFEGISNQLQASMTLSVTCSSFLIQLSLHVLIGRWCSNFVKDFSNGEEGLFSYDDMQSLTQLPSFIQSLILQFLCHLVSKETFRKDATGSCQL